MVTIAGRCGCVCNTSVVSYFTRGGGALCAGADCGLTTTCVPGCGACCTSTVVDGGGGCCGCDCTVVVVPVGTSTVVWAKAGAAMSAPASTASLVAVMKSSSG